MADVRRPGGGDGESPNVGSTSPRGGGRGRRFASARGADRGQLFIVGALALSVILVALAVLLNTAIYTGNVATRDTGVETTAVVEYQNAATSMATRTLRHANYHNNTSYSDLDDRFTQGVSRWDRTAGRHVALGGGDGHLNASTTNGTRIVQDARRNFTDANESGNWTLADGVLVRNFSANVNSSTLANVSEDDSADDFDGTFHATVRNDTGTEWAVYVYTNSTHDAVAVVRNDTTLEGTCGTTTSDPTVDLTNASLAGSHCEALAFWSAADDSYRLEYGDANDVEGTYSLVVDETDGNLLSTGHYEDDTDAGSPYVTPAIYSANLTVTYRSPSVYYRTTRRLAPGEPDAS